MCCGVGVQRHLYGAKSRYAVKAELFDVKVFVSYLQSKKFLNAPIIPASLPKRAKSIRVLPRS